MLIIKKEQALKLLTLDKCISIMEDTLKTLSNNEASMPLRSAMHVSGHNVMGLMPSYLPKYNVFGSKVISVFPENHVTGKDSHQGVVLVFDDKDGELKAVVDGIGITAIRTAAVSAVATKALAREDASNLAILGAGQQGRTHLEASLKVRDIKSITIWDYYFERAEQFALEAREKYGIKITAYKDVKSVVKDADIICTVTLAKEPILRSTDLKKGVHINAVGACRPNDREIDSETVAMAKLYVDSIESTTNEAGDYLFPLKEGLIDESHIIGEIGSLLLGKIGGRSCEEEVTMFEALGLSIEDLACADLIYKEACKQNLGVDIAM